MMPKAAKLVTNPTIKAHVLEEVAGHLERDVASLQDAYVLCDGVGNHHVLCDGESFVLDHADGHVIRILDGKVERIFRGTVVSEMPT